MSEQSFLAFCITVIAITAIVYGKDRVAEKALSALSHTTTDILSALVRWVMQHKNQK